MQHPTLSSLTAPQTAYLLSEQQVVYVVVVSTLAAPLQGHTVLAQPWKADKRVFEGLMLPQSHYIALPAVSQTAIQLDLPC